MYSRSAEIAADVYLLAGRVGALAERRHEGVEVCGLVVVPTTAEPDWHKLTVADEAVQRPP